MTDKQLNGIMWWLAGAGGFLVALAVAMVLMGCGPKTTAAVHQFTSCAEDAAAKDLGPGVQAILSGGGSSWEAQLEALALKFGEDAVTCAIEAAKVALTPTAGSGAVVTSAESPALVRADQWLAKHGAGK